MAWPAATSRSEIPDRVVARVLTRFDFDADGCMISRYSVASHGYAQVGWNSEGVRTVTVCHRIAWLAAHGDIPEGMTVDHLCKSKRCINASHMRLLPNYENARRTRGRDWPLGECAHGHSNDRLKSTPSGKRVCNDCSTRWQSDYVARRGTRMPREASSRLDGQLDATPPEKTPQRGAER